MLDSGVAPNDASFSMLMGLYRKGWNIEEAEFMFYQMRQLEILFEPAYSSMITIYTRFRLYEKAEDIISLMREDKIVPNDWLVILNAYSQQGKLRDVEKVLVSMQEAGFSPNIVAYNIMITGYGKASNMDTAQKLFAKLKNVGLDPDETTFRSMIEGWGRVDNYVDAMWYYKELKQSEFVEFVHYVKVAEKKTMVGKTKESREEEIEWCLIINWGLGL
ncbi:hypothetical protein S245_036543 [Arachis hypogaea]|nr:pentatricopeptide repeat-containing protein At4g30825, chloroplastic-like [Arachis hypogaea]